MLSPIQSVSGGQARTLVKGESGDMQKTARHRHILLPTACLFPTLYKRNVMQHEYVFQSDTLWLFTPLTLHLPAMI